MTDHQERSAMISRYFVFTVLLTGIPLPVMADEAPVISISAGVVRATTDTVSMFTEDSTLSSDYSDGGYRVALGLEFGRWLSFELGAADFGENTGVATVPALCPGSCPPGTPPQTINLKQDGRAVWFAYSPRYRVGAWEWSASIGGSRNKLRTFVPGAGPGNSIDSTGTELIIGVGAGYRFETGLGLGVNFERFGGDATHTALSLSFRF